ncbi:recombinase zinc beta ribbon domain-containing protein [Halobacillus rhizosphaerae]|uniref:recombinase zinc beta ribbon domain-containing protein n=1 Tax=Halobacillus rhizosphaerae TaxID=3064889 RepID=UPI00398B5FCB
MSLFKGKIYCFTCNKKHKYKKRSKKPVYVCSKYDNYGSNACDRNQISEEEVVWLISGHFAIGEIDVTREFIIENVSHIIAGAESIEVFYNNGQKSLISSTQMIK